MITPEETSSIFEQTIAILKKLFAQCLFFHSQNTTNTKKGFFNARALLLWI